MSPRDYASSGVDVAKGDAFASFIRDFPSKAVSRSIGGFSGGVAFDPHRYREPVLMSTTDGVGTKLLVAKKLGIYNTVGIDLVAMCVNDLIVCAVEPLSFLDYIACNRVDGSLLHELITGIIRGCEIASCTLTGGETAEMPDLYGPGDFDLAGFCNGIAERSELLPNTQSMNAGDAILALPSVGVHSNGFSLARKVIPEQDRGAWTELLVPTRIYVEEMKPLLKTGNILGAAHVTGGGLVGNFSRVIPAGLKAKFSWDWQVPDIFDYMRKTGEVDEEEMRRVFNMGIGIAMVVPASGVSNVLETGKKSHIEILQIGELVRG
ncbi:MAG TPA: phosphoribosylformylglycinamidine cyclo-ligase [Spirochaetia bacterium]|nr:phosphoribosylformylglycinamidine cyclo-ligase [Spirochaetia bacterium]